MRLTLTGWGLVLIDLTLMEPPDDDEESIPDDISRQVVALGFTTELAADDDWPGEDSGRRHRR